MLYIQIKQYEGKYNPNLLIDRKVDVNYRVIDEPIINEIICITATGEELKEITSLFRSTVMDKLEGIIPIFSIPVPRWEGKIPETVTLYGDIAKTIVSALNYNTP